MDFEGVPPYIKFIIITIIALYGGANGRDGMLKKFISWNVNGLRAVEKKGFLDFLARSGADILAVQETKAQENQLSAALLRPAGYGAYFAGALRKGYSGVACYCKEEPLSVTNGLGVAEFDAEGRTLILEYPDFYFLNIYFPNGGQGEERIAFKLRFYDAFLKKSKELFSSGKAVVACGDVNTAHTELDLARPKQNEDVTGFLPRERAWLDRFFTEGYADAFRLFEKDGGHYTWWDYKTRARERNVGWRIDYFMVDGASVPRVKSAGILTDVQGSDHCPIELTMDL